MYGVLTKLSDADLYGLTTLAFANCVGFRQTLGLVWRPRRFQARFDEIVGNADAIEFLVRSEFFGLSEQLITDRDVSIDLVDRIRGVALAVDRFRRCRQMLP